MAARKPKRTLAFSQLRGRGAGFQARLDGVPEDACPATGREPVWVVGWHAGWAEADRMERLGDVEAECDLLRAILRLICHYVGNLTLDSVINLSAVSNIMTICERSMQATRNNRGGLEDEVKALLVRNEELQQQVTDLQRQVEGHCERIAAQSELLGRRAEKP